MVNNLIASAKPSFLYDTKMESKLRDYLLEKQVLNNWNQEMMSEKLGVPTGTLSRWLSGQFAPGINSLKRIAQGLGVPLQELVDVVEGKFKPMSKDERDAVEISKKYSPESISKANELLFSEAQKRFDEAGMSNEEAFEAVKTVLKNKRKSE